MIDKWDLKLCFAGSYSPEIGISLPKLELKSFSGDILLFQEFWESFDSAVNSNENIDDITKFNYLRGLLHDQAASVISGLSLSSDNYKEAIHLLNSRYGNKQVLISAHIDKLLSLPAVNSSADIRKLREIYDVVEINVRGLKSLEVTSSQYGPMLISIVMSKLPSDIRLLASRFMSPSSEWKIDDLLNFIRTEIASREMCNNFVSTNSDKQKYTQPNKGGFSAQALVTRTYDNFNCVYCGKDHPPSKCVVVTDIRSRKSILRRQGRCFLCLKGHHILRNCESRYRCAKCKNKHHISICEPPPPPPEEISNPRSGNERNQVLSTVVNNNAKVTMLQTAKVIVVDKNYKSSVGLS